MRTLTCPECGAVFSTRSGSQRYCGKVCRDAAHKRMKVAYAIAAVSPAPATTHNTELDRVARDAQLVGLSYGIYVAKGGC